MPTTPPVGSGGAIENIHGGVVMVSRSTFFHDYANANGGAIDNGDVSGTGTLVVKSSSFSSNSAINGDGGAIANGDVGGHGSVVISGSTFSSNSAINGNGGAIDSGDTQGGGPLRCRRRRLWATWLAAPERSITLITVRAL